MKIKTLIFILFLLIIRGFGENLKDDFEYAKTQFLSGNWTVAEVYFKHIKEKAHNLYGRLSRYYLIKIYQKKGDLLKLMDEGYQFLEGFSCDEHSEEVFKVIISVLIERGAYGLAFDYIKRFNEFTIDDSVINKIGMGLYNQNPEMADSVLTRCIQTDTIKILRAMLRPPEERAKFLESVSGNRGLVYQIENLLQMGDTIEAYLRYNKIMHKRLDDGLLYRFCRLAAIFESDSINKYINKLAGQKGYKEDANFISGLLVGRLYPVSRFNKEILDLLFLLFPGDSVVKKIPDGVDIDTLLADSSNLIRNLRKLKKEYKANFKIDSLYCEVLIKKKIYSTAYNNIKPYLTYHNTKKYARLIRALFYYHNHNYKHSARDIILSNTRNPYWVCLLAKSLENLSLNPVKFYRQAYDNAEDDSLRRLAFKGLVNALFKENEFKEILKFDRQEFLSDTLLVRIYISSLLRMGSYNLADSLLNEFDFIRLDYRLANYYGEFLIDNKMLDRAEAFYDSIIESMDSLQPEIYYNYARIAFMQGRLDTAQERFKYFVDKFAGKKYFYNALYKIATINYLKQNFDSAGYYYDMASQDTTLRYDALKNEFLCYKKSGAWKRAYKTAKRLLEIARPEDEAEIYFNTGYTLLQAGRPDSAEKYLGCAIQKKPTPEYIYWLAEAYLAQADFAGALYQYQRIVKDFPRAGMWLPTARYKTGLMLEFMGRYAEARRIYKMLIRKRGADDTWSKEAKKRLRILKEK